MPWKEQRDVDQRGAFVRAYIDTSLRGSREPCETFVRSEMCAKLLRDLAKLCDLEHVNRRPPSFLASIRLSDLELPPAREPKKSELWSNLNPRLWLQGDKHVRVCAHNLVV